MVLHGLGDSAIHTYAPRFASTVLSDTPALFIDLPGFGEGTVSGPYPATIEAMAEDVEDVIHELQLHDIPVFGHSMGANIALEIASRSSNLASHLILAEPLLHPEQSVLAAGIAKHSEEWFVTRRYEMLVRATSLQMHRGDVAATAFLPTLTMADPVALYRAAASLVRERNPSFGSMLRSLHAPVTMLIGQRTHVDTSLLETMGIKVIRISNAGHSMMVEQAQSTAYAILDIVNK